MYLVRITIMKRNYLSDHVKHSLLRESGPSELAQLHLQTRLPNHRIRQLLAHQIFLLVFQTIVKH